MAAAVLFFVGSVVLVLATALPTLLGYDTYIGTGGSMEPTIPPGSVLAVQNVSPE